jgi:hypothetical protein
VGLIKLDQIRKCSQYWYIRTSVSFIVASDVAKKKRKEERAFIPFRRTLVGAGVRGGQASKARRSPISRLGRGWESLHGESEFAPIVTVLGRTHVKATRTRKYGISSDLKTLD